MTSVTVRDRCLIDNKGKAYVGDALIGPFVIYAYCHGLPHD